MERAASRCSGICVCLGLVLASGGATAAEEPVVIARIAVHAGEFARTDTPVSASLAGLELHPERSELPPERLALRLYEVGQAGPRPKPSQLEPGVQPRLWWILDGVTAPGETRRFELRREPLATGAEPPAGRLDDDGSTLTLTLEGRPVLGYRYAPLPPPPGASPLYERSGFIHPLRSPAGAVLTRVQPPDHYHHVGIWNPWTRTSFEGRKIDFWNLDDGQGTVRFAGFVSRIAGDVFAGFRALHHHVDLGAPHPSGAKLALNEEWDVRAWSAGTGRRLWLVDFTSRLSCATDQPLTIEKYRYQGFGFRARPDWDDQSARLVTSEGRDKSNGNATRARWCDVRGPSEAGTSGVLFMTSPGNFDYPELLRIWPTGANEGRENVFFNFNPAQERDWVLRPGRDYALSYRMLVYDGEITPEQAELHWRDFAHPPRVERE